MMRECDEEHDDDHDDDHDGEGNRAIVAGGTPGGVLWCWRGVI